VSKQGFTLIELMITVTVLACGIIPVIAILSSAMRVEQIAEGQVIALQLAQEQVEAFKDTAFASIVASARAPVTGFTAYERKVEVSGADPKDVKVTVYWTVKGEEQSISLETLITNPV
jgi:prepilin-type N-terminal cleavage/methylation domain-containing protein